MKVRILSGNMAGTVQDLPPREADAALATGFAEKVVAPSDPAEDAYARTLTARVRYTKGDRQGDTVAVTPSVAIRLISLGEAEHVKTQRVRYLRGERAGEEVEVSAEEAEQLGRDGEIEPVAAPPPAAEPVKVKVRYTSGPKTGEEAEVSSDEALRLVQTGEAVKASEPKKPPRG